MGEMYTSTATSGSDLRYAAFRLPDLEAALTARKYARLNTEAIQAIQDRPLLYAPQFIRDLNSWKTEFKGGNLTCWICVAPNVKTGLMSLEEGQWVGMITLHGPLSSAEYNFFDDASLEPQPYELCTRWIAGRLYVKPEHRNMDALTALHQALASFILSETKNLLGHNAPNGTGLAASARIQTTAYYGTAAYGLHRADKLRVVREVTRAEDLEYDGLLCQVPAGLLGAEDYTKPVGTLSEYVEEVLAQG